MFARLRRYFTLPAFEDEEQTRVARLVVTILFTLTVVAVLVNVIMIAMYGFPKRWSEATSLAASIIIVILTLGAFALIRRGLLRGLAIVILSVIWLVITYWIWFEEGMSGGRTSYAYPLIIVVAGLLLGARGAVALTVFSLIAISGALYVEYSGLVPVVALPVTSFDIVLIATILVTIGLLLRYAMKSMTGAIDRAHRSAQAQAEANRELEAIRVSLEQRVMERTQDLEHRSIQLQAAAEIGRAAAAMRDLDELLVEVPEMIGERLGFYHVGIFLLDESNIYAVLRGANSPEGRQMLAQGHSLVVGSPDIIGAVTAHREPRVASDTGENAVSFAGSLLPRTHAELALPLVAGDRLIGALDLHSLDNAAFTDQTISVMQLLSDQVAIAIENARLFTQSQEALEAERRAYGEISRDAWKQISRTEGALRFIVDTPGSVRPVEGEAPLAMLQARQTGRVVKEEESTLAVPIQLREGVSIGAVRLRKPEWMQDEISLVETLTEQLGAALESARLYQETQRREARERITREITEDIRRSVDIEMILQSAVTSLGEALGVPRTYVRLMLEDTDMPPAEPVDLGTAPESSPAADVPTGVEAAGLEQGEEHHEP